MEMQMFLIWQVLDSQPWFLVPLSTSYPFKSNLLPGGSHENENDVKVPLGFASRDTTS
jgi:hypothetical protein